MILNKDLNRLLASTLREVKRRNHEYITVEHLIYVSLFDEVVIDILQRCGANVYEIKLELDRYLTHEIETLPPDIITEPVQTKAFQKVMQYILELARSLNKKEADQREFLLSLFYDDSSYGIYLIKLQGVKKEIF